MGVAFNLSDCSRQGGANSREGANSASLPQRYTQSLTQYTELDCTFSHLSCSSLKCSEIQTIKTTKYFHCTTIHPIYNHLHCTVHCLILLCPSNYRGANKWFHRCLLQACTSVCICVCICICICVCVFVFVFALRPIIEVLTR